MTKTSRGICFCELGAEGAVEAGRMMLRLGSPVPLAGALPVGAGEAVRGALFSMAAASLWRAVGRCTSKHETLQNT